jgi:hypothetical protein
VVKGSVNGATVTVKTSWRGLACATTLATVTTTPAGTYSLSTACTGDVLVEVTAVGPGRSQQRHHRR